MVGAFVHNVVRIMCTQNYRIRTNSPSSAATQFPIWLCCKVWYAMWSGGAFDHPFIHSYICELTKWSCALQSTLTANFAQCVSVLHITEWNLSRITAHIDMLMSRVNTSNMYMYKHATMCNLCAHTALYIYDKRDNDHFIRILYIRF